MLGDEIGIYFYTMGMINGFILGWIFRRNV
jgi:hypothetical protein